MKILIVPDLHLGAGTSIGKDCNNGLNSRIEDQKDLLEFVFKKAKSNYVEKIVLLGDIWQHYKPDPVVVYIFLEWLVKCSEYFNVEVIQGNHDFTRSGTNKVSMLDCVEIPYIQGCSIHTGIEIQNILYKDKIGLVYIPFTDRDQLCAKTIDEAKDILFNNIKDVIDKSINDWSKTKNICFGHLALEGSIWVGNEVSDDSNEIFVTKDMMNRLGFDYVFMGHVHKPQMISNSNPYMVHVGSLDKTKFTGPDATEKHITLFDTKTDEITNLKLPCRNLIDFTITIPKIEDETEFVINYIDKNSKQKLDKSIVRIKIEADSPEYKYINREKIGNFLKEAGVFNISSITETKFSEQVLKNDIGIDETISHDDAIDIFIETLKGSNHFKSQVKKVCKDIIKKARLK